MKTAILIVSYAKDIPYLVHCLRSIQKFATGFQQKAIVVPGDEYNEFENAFPSTLGDLIKYDRVKDSRKWHLHAQVQKCLADQHCPGADFVLHMDSDCIFTEPVTPEDYFVNGKPVMVYQAYNKLPGDVPWRGPTMKALGFDPVYSFMQRHPQVNPIGLYYALRRYLQDRHRQPFDQYVLSLKADFPWGFSEHNALGAYAYWKGFRDQYHWIDSGAVKPPHEKVRQFWSLSPPDKKQASPHGEPEATPLEIINRILGV